MDISPDFVSRTPAQVRSNHSHRLKKSEVASLLVLRLLFVLRSKMVLLMKMSVMEQQKTLKEAKQSKKQRKKQFLMLASEFCVCLVMHLGIVSMTRAI